MTNDIFGWLTGGVYQTFPELLWGALETLIRFGTNVAYIFIGGFWSIISPLLPNMSRVSSSLENVLNYALPIASFIKDTLMISGWVFNYILISVIFRVSIKMTMYLTNIVISIYNKLKP